MARPLKIALVLAVGYGAISLGLSAVAAQGPLTLKPTMFATAPAGASEPDSITVGAGSVWVSYAGGTSADGKEPTGNSTVVRYSMTGAVQHTYSIKGSVDGLKFNPTDGTIWALQNQDANSSLSVINPATDGVAAMSYADVSQTQGYDDVVFRGKDIFLSYTNPAKPGDVTVRKVVAGTSPIQVTPIITAGTPGMNLVSGAAKMVPKVADPDSLKLAPNGDLVQTSGDRNALVFIANPGEASQKVSYLPLTGPHHVKVTGLDDSMFVTAASGRLFITETGANRVMVADLTGVTPGSLLANVGSLKALGLIDMKTGVVTPVASGLSGPHGLAFAEAP